MSKSTVFAFLFLASLRLVSGQFNIFESMFGQQQHQHQQPQHKSGPAYSDGVSCSQYLCPATLDCVARPKDCPCPNVEDIKCLIPDMVAKTEDATVVCTRGQDGCVKVEMLMRKGVKSKRK